MTDAYRDYLATINQRFEALFSEIKTVHNYENGPEFETALCAAFRAILPQKYGVCCGYVFTVDGREIGDDIIIYDQQKFPVLRFLNTNDYTKRQHIPVEAVVAYIEAKNTIIMKDGENNSLSRAIKQSTDIKRLGRQEIPINPFHEYGVTLGKHLQIDTYLGHPQINNPFFTCIFARGVREKKGGKLLDNEKITELLMKRKNVSSEGETPDLVVLNSDVFLYPVVNGTFVSPFYRKDLEGSKLFIQREIGCAWGLAIALMFDAFSKIHLSGMDWTGIFSNALNMNQVDDIELKLVSPENHS